MRRIAAVMKQTKPSAHPPSKILVVDAGGTHIKLMVSGSRQRIKIDSGPHYTPRRLIIDIGKYAPDWEYEAITLGVPTPVIHNRPAREPNNLGRGWMKFDFEKAFGKPCKIINDATMQALGSYDGGRMLFLGLGTGVGSAMVLDDVVIPLELGELAYDGRRRLEDMLGREGRRRLGQKKWEASLDQIVQTLRNAFVTDYVVIGGGNARHVTRLPKGARLGDNRNAFLGGLRLWGISSRRVDTKAHTLVIR